MPDKIAAGLVSRTYFNVPLWAAQEHGFFAKEGLQVEGTIYGNASQVAPLLDGTFQVYIGSPELPIQNQAEGGPLKIVAGNAGKLVHSLITRAPFKRIEDLRGRMIGIFSDKEGTFFHVKAMLEAHGLNYPGDYQVKHTGGVPPRHKALLAGEIDAGLQSVPWNYVAEEVGMNNLGDVIEYVPDWQFVSVNINSQWAEKNRDAAGAFSARDPARHRVAVRQPRRRVRDRRPRIAGADPPCRTGMGFLHRHRCADARCVGEPEGAGAGHRYAEGNQPAGEERERRSEGVCG